MITVNNHWQDLNSRIGAETGTVVYFRLAGHSCVGWVDDEGLLKSRELNAVMSQICGQMIVGDAIVAIDHEGEMLDLPPEAFAEIGGAP
jgi:hypothetical protein